MDDDYTQALAPITVFVESVMPVQKRMMDILPKKEVCDRLVASYIDVSETIYRMIHVPTFMDQYERYWNGSFRADHFLPQLLAICSVASRFETKSKGMGHERVEGVHIPTSCALITQWLDGLKGKQLVDFTTLQVQLILLQARRMITPRLHDSWVSFGNVVRLAMTMGMHRDPSEFEPRISVFQGEIRRRLWYSLLDLDLHISLSCNLPCTIREGDYTTRPPRNLDDVELYPNMLELPPSKSIDQETDNQMQVYAAMTLTARLKVSHLVNRLDEMRDYHEVMEVGSRLERFLEDINYIFPRHGILNDSQRSKLWRTRVILDMHVRRPLLALYRPFAIGLPDAPAQISRAYLRSSIVILKYLDEIDPMMSHYQEIVGMYHAVLKRDIIQAAFGVSCFIRSAMRRGSDGGSNGLRLTPDSSDDFPSYSAENMVLWSPSRLIGTVQKTLDLLLSHLSGGDIKAIVCLVVVLESSKTMDTKEEELTHSLRHVLDHLLRTQNVTTASISQLVTDGGYTGEIGAHNRVMYGYGDTMSMGSIPDYDAWTMWTGWDA